MTPRPSDRYLGLIWLRLSKPLGVRQTDLTCAAPTMSIAAHMIRPKLDAVRSWRRACRAFGGFLAAA